MFFEADNLQSTAIRSLKLNPATNQAIVEYVTSAKSFLYENIDADAIVDFFFGEFESAGKFVNAYCKGCLLYTSPSPRDRQKSRMPSSA